MRKILARAVDHQRQTRKRRREIRRRRISKKVLKTKVERSGKQIGITTR